MNRSVRVVETFYSELKNKTIGYGTLHFDPLFCLKDLEEWAKKRRLSLNHEQMAYAIKTLIQKQKLVIISANSDLVVFSGRPIHH